MATFVNTSTLDFDSYRESLKQYLRAQPQFRDFDFDGSNMAVLLDVLTYNTYNNAFYLNMVGSEMFLDSAQLRQSVISHAKELNYTPRSRSSARAVVDITLSGNSLPDSVVIPKGWTASARSDDGASRFTFVTREPIVVTSAASYIARGVELFQGTVRTELFSVESSSPADNRFVLGSQNVDIDSIEVEVLPNSTSAIGTGEVWQRATVLFGASPSSKIFFVQAKNALEYEIIFGNGVVGSELTPGAVVVVKYRDTAGSDANGLRNFTPTTAIPGVSGISIATVSPAIGGSMHESTEEIRFNAPRFFSTQERAVTQTDFVTLLTAAFPTLETVTAYGGEEATPKQYGKVIVSAKPFGSELLPESLKSRIINYLRERTTLSIDPVIVDPNFLYAVVNSRITYNLNATVKTPAELSAAARVAITEYNNLNLSKFGSDLRYSRLLGVIDQADPSFVSSDTDLLLSKRLTPAIGVASSFTWSYGNALVDMKTNINNQPGLQPTVFSSAFTFNLNGVGYQAQLRDNGVGGLVIVSLVGDGAGAILQTNAGSVNYATGVVNISNVVFSGVPSNGVVKIFARLEGADIETDANNILLIDSAQDVNITLEGIRL